MHVTLLKVKVFIEKTFSSQGTIHKLFVEPFLSNNKPKNVFLWYRKAPLSSRVYETSLKEKCVTPLQYAIGQSYRYNSLVQPMLLFWDGQDAQTNRAMF